VLNHAIHMAAVTQDPPRHPRTGLLQPETSRRQTPEKKPSKRWSDGSPTPSTSISSPTRN